MMGQYVVVPHSEVPSGTAPVPANITATVALKPSGDLQGLVNALNDPNNPAFRHFLTINAVASGFGSTSYATAVDYFESYGLSVQPSAGLLTLSVSGSPAQMGAAFHTSFTAFAETYHSQGLWNPLYGDASAVANSTEYGAGFYANTAPLSLPSSLAGVVDGVSGLAGMTAQPQLVAPQFYGPGVNVTALAEAYNATHPGLLQATPYTSSITSDPTLTSIQGLAGANFTWYAGAPHSFDCSFFGIGCSSTQTLYPSTMHALSGAGNLWTGATTLDSQPDLGQGITIALIEVGCLDMGTVNQFSSQVWNNPSQPGTSLAARLTQIALNTPDGLYPNSNLADCVQNGQSIGWTTETALDAEFVSTMAPLAHIDIIGVPAPGYFSAFDVAYTLIAQDLSLSSTGGTCPAGALLPATSTGSASPGLYVVSGSTTGACSITITSNSYGAGEMYTAFSGSPMYITVEDTLLEELNAVGVTNFFASGDHSGASYAGANQAGAPAVSPGSTSVGGGQTTAESNGSAFPVTGTAVCSSSFYLWDFGGSLGSQCVPNYIAQPPSASICNVVCAAPQPVASATGLAGFTYWAYGGYVGGTNRGEVGGGFGQSILETQPWWQNGLDTYSTGAAMDPVVSFEAAFNETLYVCTVSSGCLWLSGYGGTSFATPTVAGEWALIEEQANVAYGTPAMGDINPLLYAAHNAQEAGVSSFAADPFVDMTDQGYSWMTAPVNEFNWHYTNLSFEQPYDVILPWWFNTLYNPAGPQWNYLQGLGLIQISVLDQELIGPTGLAGHSLTNPAFQVQLVTPGGLVPLPGETLTAGTSYTLEVVDTNGQPGVYNVAAYSGQSSQGAYGGGTVSSLQSNASGQFTYTPASGTPPGRADATTYGYFLVTSLVGTDWSFAQFAVAQPAAQGNLSLCVVDPSGICDTGVAEVTTLTTAITGDYNVFPRALVTLNGAPVGDAVVKETAVNVTSYQVLDPTLPLSSFAPGASLGQFITGSSGDSPFWTDTFTAELGGYLPTQVVKLTATYGGLVSNTVTVFVEPQTGSFNTSQLSLNSAGTAVVGTLFFNNMKDVNFVNVSIGSAPGQFVNVTYPPVFYDSNGSVWVSGVASGQIAVNLSAAGLAGPVELSLLASGTNDLTDMFCLEGGLYCQGTYSVQNPIVWADPIVFLPATLVASQTTRAVAGNDTFAWTGTAYPGATGTLELVSPGGSNELATGMSGSYTLDTASLMDGWYSVVFTEHAPGVTTTKTATFYTDNQAVADGTLIAQLNSELAADNVTIGSLSAAVASLQSGWAATNTTIAQLNSTLGALRGELSTAQETVAGLQSQLDQLNQTNAADQSMIVSLQGQLTTANATIASDVSQIGQLQSRLSTLQNDTGSKKTVAPVPWYTVGGGGIVLLAALTALGVAVGATGAHLMGRRRDRTVELPAKRPPDEPTAHASSTGAAPLAVTAVK